MKTCPVCETQNQDGAKNCECCGEVLAIPQVGVSGAATEPGAGAKEEKGTCTTEAQSGGSAETQRAIGGDDRRAGAGGAVPVASQAQEPIPAAPLPPPIVAPKPAGPCVVIYQNRAPVFRHFLVNDETLIGRADPVSGAFPDLDMTKFDPDRVASRKHAFIYRQEGKFVLHALSDGGTQLNQELLQGGDRRDIKEGDVIILGAKIALKFEVVQ